MFWGLKDFWKTLLSQSECIISLTLYVERKCIVSNNSCIEDVCSRAKVQQTNNTHTQGIISWSSRRNGSPEGAMNAKNKRCYIIIITLLSTITVCKWTWLICKVIAREDREGKKWPRETLFYSAAVGADCRLFLLCNQNTLENVKIYNTWDFYIFQLHSPGYVNSAHPWWEKRVIIVKPNWES